MRAKNNRTLKLLLLFLIPLLFFCILYLPKGYASFPINFLIGCILIAIPFFLRICGLWGKFYFLLGESWVLVIFVYWLVVKIELFPAWTVFSAFLLIAVLTWIALYMENKNRKKGNKVMAEES